MGGAGGWRRGQGVQGCGVFGFRDSIGGVQQGHFEKS